MRWLERERLREERTLAVAEAINQAINTPQTTHSPPRTELPEPHLPLRKASAHKLKSAHAPQPLFAPSQHQLRGFNPTPVQPLPHVDAVTASSEHAFAGRNARRPSKLPLGSLALQHGENQTPSYPTAPKTSIPELQSLRTPSSPLTPPPIPPESKEKRVYKVRSFGEGLRGLRSRMSSNRSIPESSSDTPSSSILTDEPRQSFKSAYTTNSSYLNTSSIATDRSSLVSSNSMMTEYAKVYPGTPETEHGPDTEMDGGLSVDDVYGLYAEGFESAKQSMDTYGRRSLQSSRPSVKQSMENSRRLSLQIDRPLSQPSLADNRLRPNALHRRSQSASLLDQWKPPAERMRSVSPSPLSTNRLGMESKPEERPTSQSSTFAVVPRDRYGFKKASHYISVQQYDAWDAVYSKHLERRSKKWHALMKSYGLSTEQPFRFPPKSDKIKRYVRKGIPPEFRGAAWYWYAGGPSRLAKTHGLYATLLRKVADGALSDNDREHIERDLNRTFPDNIRFKPDAPPPPDVQAGSGGGRKKRKSVEPETSIVRALRRVLQAFAVNNPSIGYCQSLNFIAGLLLLFLDEDEEKAFTLLEIVTSIHLPGTHGIALEGANIDIAVLMSLIREHLGAIWAKLDDKGGGIAGDPAAQALRLPTVSLATTAWFMSLFVGTLPIESVLRVWDCLFFEGSKTLFRIALAIFKYSEPRILAVSDSMEIFQLVQTVPRGMLDVNRLMEMSFRRGRGQGFGSVSQNEIERRREERRRQVRDGVAKQTGGGNGLAMAMWRGRWRSKTKA